MTAISRDALLAAFAVRRGGTPEQAEQAFRALLALDPAHPESLHGLSLALADQGRQDEALSVAEAAVRAAPGHPGLYYTLGLLLEGAGRSAAARDAYLQAARLKPDFHQAWNNLGLIQLGLGADADAAASLRRAVEVQPDYALGWVNLAKALTALREADAALTACERALALAPDHREALAQAGRVLERQNRMDEARGVHERLAAAYPHDLEAALGAGLALPSVYVSPQAVAEMRARYADGLARIEAGLDAMLDAPPERLLAALDRTNFLLAYQGEDDTELQARYARIVARVLARVMPEMLAPLPWRGRARLRVGFAGAFFHDCTAGQYFKSWITDLPHEEFEVHVFVLGGAEDAVAAQIGAAASGYRRLTGGVADSARVIRGADLDVLIYPELGMHGPSFVLAGMRLAPVQCMGWGHPVTSGHATIDYYLSCAAMEPADGAGHYTETLVTLPGLGTRYERPALGGTRTRADFGLPADAHVYLYPHALFKLHPENDALLGRVLAADVRGVAAVCEGQSAAMTQAYLARVRPVLAAHGVEPERLHVLPFMTRADFVALNGVCDLMLDATRWSGGNTSLDAFAAGLPVVTRRGRYMRGRQTAGMLDLMGIPELVARDEDEYLALARRVACDRDWRASLSARIVAARDRLFGDPTPVAALAEFLRSIERRRAP